MASFAFYVAFFDPVGILRRMPRMPTPLPGILRASASTTRGRRRGRHQPRVGGGTAPGWPGWWVSQATDEVPVGPGTFAQWCDERRRPASVPSLYHPLAAERAPRAARARVAAPLSGNALPDCAPFGLQSRPNTVYGFRGAVAVTGIKRCATQVRCRSWRRGNVCPRLRRAYRWPPLARGGAVHVPLLRRLSPPVSPLREMV